MSGMHGGRRRALSPYGPSASRSSDVSETPDPAHAGEVPESSGPVRKHEPEGAG